MFFKRVPSHFPGGTLIFRETFLQLIRSEAPDLAKTDLAK